MRVHFDESLPILARVVSDYLGRESLEKGVVLREVTGRLAFFAREALPSDRLEHLGSLLRESLDGYAREDRVVADSEALGTAAILSDTAPQRIYVNDLAINLVDRRIVGADWLQRPNAELANPPRVVFASLKGGVGRSTALSVLASDQARKGRNVLVIDLDLEAPGVGSMLLNAGRMPRIGTLDLLVEGAIGALDAGLLSASIGTSELTDGLGLVDVVPVAGTASIATPSNYLAKLSRAMQEDVVDGRATPLFEKTRAVVDLLASRKNYDLVLIDARAGMSELTAGPILALGASVLLFGSNQPQTLDGYRYLLAHLSTLTRPYQASPWQQIRMFHAKAPMSDAARTRFQEQMWELFSDYLYEELEGIDGFNFDVADPDAPHNPVPVLFDSRFIDWNPVSRPGDLDRQFYEVAYGPFISAVERMAEAARDAAKARS